MKGRIKVIPGGSSAGKTWAIIPILIDKCIKNPGLTVSICSESMPHLKRGAMRDFLNIMKLTNRYRDSQWNRTNSIYTFNNDSYIEFFGVEDSSKLLGARRSTLYINECSKVTEEVYTQLAMRTDQDIYLDYNPSNRFWTDEVLKSDEAEKLILTYKDNEALSPSVIKFLESKLVLAQTSDYWKNWCNVYLYGLPGQLEGTIFNNWTEIDSVPHDAEYVGAGLDFGFSQDPTAMVAVYRYNGGIILDEIIYRKGLSNSELSALIKDSYLKGEIYADSADPKSIDELKKYGHHIQPAKKGPDSIAAGIKLLHELPMSVTKRSINLKNELNNYTWKKDASGNNLNVPIDIFNHIIDATRYLAIMKLGKKIKGSFGFDFINI